MKITDMSRKDALFWTMNIMLSVILCMSFYVLGQTESIPAVPAAGACSFMLSWMLTFTMGCLFRGSYTSLRKAFQIVLASILLMDIWRVWISAQVSLDLGRLGAELAACFLGALVILIHEKALI